MVCECDCEALIMRRPWPTGAVAPCKRCMRHILYVCWLNEARTVVVLGDVLEEETEQSKCEISAKVGSSLLLTSVKKCTRHCYQEFESRDFKFVI